MKNEIWVSLRIINTMDGTEQYQIRTRARQSEPGRIAAATSTISGGLGGPNYAPGSLNSRSLNKVSVWETPGVLC